MNEAEFYAWKAEIELTINEVYPFFMLYKHLAANLRDTHYNQFTVLLQYAQRRYNE